VVKYLSKTFKAHKSFPPLSTYRKTTFVVFTTVFVSAWQHKWTTVPKVPFVQIKHPL